MCVKKPKFDIVQKIEEELEEGGGPVFDGGLDVEEDGYDDSLWGETGGAFGGTDMVWTGTIQVRNICLVFYPPLPGHMARPGSVQSGA